MDIFFLGDNITISIFIKKMDIKKKKTSFLLLSKLGGQGGLVRSHDFWIGYFENIWSDMHSQVCLQVRIAIF